jgi:hypothetical protein
MAAEVRRAATIENLLPGRYLGGIVGADSTG